MKPARRRRIGIVSGLVVGALSVGWLGADGNAQLHAPGPMNTSHDTLDCEACHEAAPGTLRQQLQTAARGALGGDVEVDVGFRAVTSARCRACHQRADDRHPIGRFLEPRFAEVREKLQPEECASCHREHRGARITVGETTFCRHCHAELAIEHDPVDVSHRQLVAMGRWESCLGCHDYHGNHRLASPRRLGEAIAVERIETYFEGGESPYPPSIHRAKLEVAP